MIAHKVHAKLHYGHSSYEVTLDALPNVFDHNDPIECAKTIFACISNASGGHRLKNCRVMIDHNRKIANLVAEGAHAYYSPNDLPKLSLEDALELHKNQVVYFLGDVITDQYGDGWKRATWVETKPKNG